MEKFTLKDVLDWTEGKLENNNDISDASNIVIHNISKDTRTIEDGDIYIALAGKVFDGHEFINQAITSGARYAIASSLDKVSDENKPKIILVDDTQRALNKLSRGYLNMLDIPVVAITGSVGKTTTREMIASVLKQKYKILVTKDNLNNNFGCPFTIFELDKTYELAVIEGGMNHFGELENISEAINPNTCVITNIGDSHIGNLGSRENIFKAKCEIFKYMKDDAKLVLNKDDDFLPQVEGNKDIIPNLNEVIYTGISDITSKEVNQEEGSITYKTKDNFIFKINSLTENISSAAMLAREVGKLYNLTDDEIKNGIESFNNIAKRAEVVKENNITYICDYYNSCLNSIKSGVETLSNYKKDSNRIIAILGDVKELGEYENEIHTKIGETLNNYNVDRIYFVGEAIKNAYDSYTGQKEYYKDKEDFINDINKESFYKDDVIFIKASNSCKFGDIFEALKEKL